MSYLVRSKWVAVLLIIVYTFSGCTHTIPSRASRAVPVQTSVLYPVKICVFPFVDKRALEQQVASKHISWPHYKGQVDFYGKEVEKGLAKAVSEYLVASHVFAQAETVGFIVNQELLKSQGCQYLLTANIEEFNSSLSVPALILAIAVAPNPLFFIMPGITLVPLIIWPKQMTFDTVLDQITLKDLNSGKIIWTGKIEIHENKKKISRHITAKWFLGETAELVAKEMVQKLKDAKLTF